MKMKMSKLYKQINCAGMVLLFLLSSCSDEIRVVIPKPDGKWVPLQVASATAGVQSRADDRTVLNSGRIGVFLKEDAVNRYGAITNLEFTYATPFWQTNKQILLGDQLATLAAYYPYSGSQVNPVVLKAQPYNINNDFYYINFQANNQTAPITLDLSRVYSRIVFNFKADPTYLSQGRVTAIRLEGNGIVPVATLDMLDGTVRLPSKSVRDILLPVTNLNRVEMDGLTTQFTSSVAGTVDCFMIPHLLDGEINITITADGKKKTGKVTAEQLCGISKTLTEGVKYQVNISIRQLEGLVIQSIKTADWVSQIPWDESVNFEPVP